MNRKVDMERGLNRRVTDLEARLDPKELFRVCFWTEEPDGTDLQRMDPGRCDAGLDHPSREDCERCSAHRIVLVFVGSREDIDTADRRHNEVKVVPNE
jgi:hypothetical protein